MHALLNTVGIHSIKLWQGREIGVGRALPANTALSNDPRHAVCESLCVAGNSLHLDLPYSKEDALQSPFSPNGCQFIWIENISSRRLRAPGALIGNLVQ